MGSDFEQASAGIMRMLPNRQFVLSAWDEAPVASEAKRGMLLRTEGGAGEADQLVYYRKNADDTFDAVSLGSAETTIIIRNLLPVSEEQSPTDIENGVIAISTGAADPYAKAGVLSLNTYRQARIRWAVDGGTEGVVGSVVYSKDGGNVYVSLLTATFDFGVASGASDWEDLPAAVLGASDYLYLNLGLTGTGSASPNVSIFLDLRG